LKASVIAAIPETTAARPARSIWRADERPDRGRHRRQPVEVADRASAPVGGEGGGDDRHREREHDRGPDPLHDPGADDQPRRRCAAAEDRGDGEGRDADDQDPTAAEDVAEAAAGDEKRGQRQEIAADHELEVAGRGAEVGRHPGQRQVQRKEVGWTMNIASEAAASTAPGGRPLAVSVN
jgi:hypothetical protein